MLVLEQMGDEGLWLRLPSQKKGEGVCIGIAANDLIAALQEAVKFDE